MLTANNHTKDLNRHHAIVNHHHQEILVNLSDMMTIRMIHMKIIIITIVAILRAMGTIIIMIVIEMIVKNCHEITVWILLCDE